MLGIEVIPAALYLLLVSVVPESPRWLLLHKNDHQAALGVLSHSGEANPGQVRTDIRNEQAKRSSEA